MNSKKAFKIILSVLVLLILILVVLYFVNSNNYAKSDEGADLKEKISQEIFFLDDYIISMANSLNNINLENYIVKSETITGQSSKEDNNAGSGGSDKSSGSSSNSQTSSGDTSTTDEKKDSASAYVIEPSDVLLNDRIPDWESVKIAVERLYRNWQTITMDLYEINVEVKDIQNFSKDLDELTKYVKAEDKNNSLTYVSRIYSYLPIFGDYIFDNSFNNNLLRTK